MNILAFDQAFVKTGWASGTHLGATSCGELYVPNGRFDSLGSRMLKVERGLETIIEACKPDLIVFEAHRAHTGVQAAQVLGAVSLAIMRMASAREIAYSAAEVSQAKQAFTGTGRASKQLVMAVAKKKYPHFNIASDNVADALAIHHWACLNLGPLPRRL